MKVVISKKEVKEMRPKYRQKYSDESVEILRQRAIQEKENRKKVYTQSRYENNNYIYRGKNISDNKKISDTVKRYLGPPGSIIEGEKIPLLSPHNPLTSIPRNLVSSDAVKFIYDENDHILCAKDPSNLVARMKINDKLKYGSYYNKSEVFSAGKHPSAVDLAKGLRAMNPSFFNPQTDAQNTKSYVPDLLYQSEMDRVDSLHNAIVRPNSFIPPPVVCDPKAAMTSQSLGNVDYYPTNTNFFSKDPFKCYSTTMNLIDQMSREKPVHLKEYDRRFINEGNVLSTGNLLYTKNDKIQPNRDVQEPVYSPSVHELSPAPQGNVPQPQRYGIVVDRVPSTHVSPKERATSDKKSQGRRTGVLSKKSNIKSEDYEEQGKLD